MKFTILSLLFLFAVSSYGQNFGFSATYTSAYSVRNNKSDHEKLIASKINGLNHKIGLGVSGNISKNLKLELYMTAYLHKLNVFSSRASFPNQYPDFIEPAHIYYESSVLNLGPEINLRYTKYKLQPYTSILVTRHVYDQTKFVAYELREIIDTGSNTVFQLTENSGFRSQFSLGVSYNVLETDKFSVQLKPNLGIDINLKNSYIPKNLIFSNLGVTVGLCFH